MASTSEAVVECSFFIPIRRDAILSDGEPHENETWQWLDGELYGRFGCGTIAPGRYRGFYTDPDTREKVEDESRRFIIALPRSELKALRALLVNACARFKQKCIYLSIAGMVEFVERKT